MVQIEDDSDEEKKYKWIFFKSRFDNESNNFTKYVLSELKLGSNSRASKEYRQKIAKVLIKRAFLQLKEDVYGN